MKKTLIALAAVVATGAAFAQSSVTLYGVADASIVKSTDVSTQMSSSGAFNNGNSRWGVRGSEDLGGGLKAGFNYEAGLKLTDGSANTSGGEQFSRAAWMSLSGGFGDLRLGRSLTPAFYGIAAWELTGTANYGVVGSQFGYFNTRASSQIMYTTPNFAGVKVSVGHILKGNNAADLGRTSLNTTYNNGPVVVGLAYDKLSGAESSKSLGAAYNFGAFKVAGSLQDPAGVAKGFTIGGGATFGAVSLVLDIARDTEAKDTDLLLEAKYALSKRTFAYAAVVRNGKGEAPTNVNNLALGVRHNF
jgi:predicted porin